jgi:hypothetical protein
LSRKILSLKKIFKVLYEKPALFFNLYRSLKTQQNICRVKAIPLGQDAPGGGRGNSMVFRGKYCFVRWWFIRNGWAEIFQRSQEFSWLKILIPLPMYCKPEIIVKKAVPQTKKSIKRGKGDEYLEKRE